MMKLEDLTIAIIGLGYVGLPLAVAFSKKRKVIGFDISESRIEELANGLDNTLEVCESDLKNTKNLSFTNHVPDIKEANFYIVTVPTPIDENNKPNLEPLLSASKTIGSVLKQGDIVVYESTVYPGTTEEECVPVLEKNSSLNFNHDFFVGYSPERINPGDKTRPLESIVKITSGSTEDSRNLINDLYLSIISAGTHLASSIKVAEAAKVIENTQRDINIGLINELAIIFNLLKIDTEEVLKAAGTKWNFLPFQPGLVGGHCIGVDPYYLTHKAQSLGYQPELILAARKLNDGMAKYVVLELVKFLSTRDMSIKGCNVLVMGLTFKENCPDIRNTKVLDIISELSSLGMRVDCHDPWVADNANFNNSVNLVSELTPNHYEVVILAVAHLEYISMNPEDIRALCKTNGMIYDLKNIINKDLSDLRL
ncbi:nucleotide sugar dehydrogenase [Gammaproteobacteria bacterium]|nr:nucleotide sugar dehydrogenase [Gammaproteobacteria bacterium]